MNLLFIISHSIESDHSGITKKIKSQLDSFNKIIGRSFITHLESDSNNIYYRRMINNEVLQYFKANLGIISKIMWRIQYGKILEFITKENITIVVIRYTHFANPFFTRFLKNLRDQGVWIVLEIPTYPYDKEYASSRLEIKIIKLIENYSRSFFKYYVNLILTFSNEELIFGVKTLKINNGIDLQKIPVANRPPLEKDVNLIAVSSMEFWHGYDRMIEGLKNYYCSTKATRDVYFHLIGNDFSVEGLKYRKLVELYGLEKYVIFHGHQSGPELNHLFSKSHLAIGCLAVHRKGIKFIKSLKNSEYCARGLPFVYSEIDDTFEGKSFVLKISPDDSPIEIESLIKFLILQSDSASDIREYAVSHLTWDSQIEKLKNILK